MDSIRRLDDDFFSQLQDILTWATDLGVSRNSRFHLYERNMKKLRAHDREEDRARLYSQLSAKKRLTEILSTMTETIELVEMIPDLRKHDVAIPKELLLRAFSGPVDAFQESQDSSKARNAMFELSMGAMAARGGYKPVFSTTNPDVSFEFEGRAVKMECKRVLSETKILRRLADGVTQLKKSVGSGTLEVGIVAISLSKLINLGDKILVSESPREYLGKQLQNWLQANEHKLGKMSCPGTKGFLLYLSSPVYVPNSGYASLSAGIVFPLDLTEQAYLRRLADSLAA